MRLGSPITAHPAVDLGESEGILRIVSFRFRHSSRRASNALGHARGGPRGLIISVDVEVCGPALPIRGGVASLSGFQGPRRGSRLGHIDE